MNTDVIPNIMEKYMSFMLGWQLLFIDSFQFMSSSLDSLGGNLPRNAFKYTSQEFQGDELELMIWKGVRYPSDYMDSFDRFEETELPSKNDFYSILNDEHILDT